jgi:hypothetical protein
VFLQATAAQPSQPAAVVAPKPKSSSDFANLDAFLGASSATHRVANSSPPSNQLHGANFFSMADEAIRHSSSAPVTPAHSRPETPSSASIKSADNGGSKHNNLKSSILSLYNSPRANASAGGLNAQPTTSYANNLGNFQQQLSGLAMGPPSGVIPQPPQQQANQYQNVWGGFQEGSSQQAWSNNNNHDLTGFNQAPAFQQQNTSHMPQGGQFFSTDYSNRPASANSTSPSNPPQRPNFE